MIVQVMIQPAVTHQSIVHHMRMRHPMSLLSSYRQKSWNLVVKTTLTTVLHINISVRQYCSSSGTLSVSVVEGPESQEVALSTPKKRKIPVGIVLPNQVSFMELYVVLCMESSQLEMFVDAINKIRGCKTSKGDGNLVPFL